MAAVATSAALPWMGVLMAARSACPCACQGTHQSGNHVPFARALQLTLSICKHGSGTRRPVLPVLHRPTVMAPFLRPQTLHPQKPCSGYLQPFRPVLTRVGQAPLTRARQSNVSSNITSNTLGHASPDKGLRTRATLLWHALQQEMRMPKQRAQEPCVQATKRNQNPVVWHQGSRTCAAPRACASGSSRWRPSSVRT